MEVNSTLVGVIIVLLIFVPVAYLILNSAGIDKKVKKVVAQMSLANGIKLNTIDVIGSLVIGVDEESKKLVYTNKKDPSNDFQIIDMKTIKDCHIKTVMHNKKSLDWVGLEVTGSGLLRDIPFYAENNDEELAKDPYVCLQEAKKWESRIKPLLLAS